MIESHIKKWIFESFPIHEISLGDDKSKALTKIPSAKLNGDENNGYYYDDSGYRFGFNENIIDEIGVDFNRIEQNVNIENYGSINLLKAKIHEVLNFLNDNQLKWFAVKTVDVNHLYIQLYETKIILIFDIYEGRLNMITKSNL